MYVATPDLRVVPLDDEAVVFNPFSWETHVLNPAAALVLDIAAEGPCSAADIAEVFAEVLDDDERPRAAEHAHSVLAQLLGLRLLTERPLDADAGR